VGDNQTTLQSYDSNIQAYFDATPGQVSGHVKIWIDLALSHTPKELPILELGSGTGRDASYIEGRGYQVVCSDAASGFVERLREGGHDTRMLNTLTDDLGGPYGLILANAVFVHFTPAQTQSVLRKCHEALGPNGLLAISVKQGSGSEWQNAKLSAPRFFQYWDITTLSALLERHNFRILSVKDVPSSSRPGVIWLHFITQKLK
jgi:SAM-dependent methyltransferase